MRTQATCFLLGLLFGLLAAFSVWSAVQQNADYLIDRDTINAGGGLSSGGNYILTGSIGQPFAMGRQSNSQHINFSGFWGGGAADAPQMYTVAVLLEGDGRVTGEGLDCPGDCSHQYAEGADLLLNPTADPCWRFVEWRLDGAPVSGPIAVDRDITITALFAYCCPDAFSLLSPADLASNQDLDADLTWEAAANATSYRVSFGTNSPPPELDSVTGVSYDPGALEPGTSYFWRIDAVNSCGAVAGEEWSFSTTHLPQITSEPPPFNERSYRYNADAIDADGDMLSFSLPTAPPGMEIEAGTGILEWTPAADQIGTYAVTVRVEDGKGGEDEQSFSLDVTEDSFTMMTVGFLRGVDPETGSSENDGTVISLSKDAAQSLTEILLPDLPDLFDFSEAVAFYFTFENGIVLVPEASMLTMAVVDASSGGEDYEDIHYDDLAGLSLVEPGKQLVDQNRTLVFQRDDGRYFKIGKCEAAQDQWAVTFAYQELLP